MSFLFGDSFQQRRREPEWMDQPGLPIEMHRHALRSLACINWFSRSSQILLPKLIAAAQKTRPLRVLDLACGGGDVVRSLAQATAARSLEVEWLGCDTSAVAIEYAREEAAAAAGTKVALPSRIAFEQCDVLNEPLPSGFHVIMCSLFLHHLEEDSALSLLERMRTAAEHLVLVNDLERSRWGYLMAQVACRILTRSPVVHFDGPLSVAGAFSMGEMRKLADQAGLTGASLSRRWPARFLLAWSR